MKSEQLLTQPQTFEDEIRPFWRAVMIPWAMFAGAYALWQK